MHDRDLDIDSNQKADKNETEIVLGKLNECMTGVKWIMEDGDGLYCLKYKARSANDANDVVKQIKQLFNHSDLAIERDASNVLKIPNYIVAELNSADSKIPWPAKDMWGFSGDSRIHTRLMQVMNSKGLDYDIDDGGVCFAYGKMAQKAFHMRDVKTLSERWQWFDDIKLIPSEVVLIKSNYDDIDDDLENHLDALNLTEKVAFARFENKLFFIDNEDSKNRKYSEVKVSRYGLAEFDKAIKPGKGPKLLTEDDLSRIAEDAAIRDVIPVMPYVKMIQERGIMEDSKRTEMLAFFDGIKLFQDSEKFYSMFNGCDIVSVKFPPDINTIHEFHYEHASKDLDQNSVLMRYQDKLYYVNKTENICNLIDINVNDLKEFDKKLNPDYTARKLTEIELSQALSIIKRNPFILTDKTISEVVRSVEQKDEIYNVDAFTGVYKVNDLIDYIESFQAAIRKSKLSLKKPISLMTHNINHEMCIGYDPEKEEWMLSNVNNNQILFFSTSKVDIEKMAASIMRGYYQVDTDNSIKNSVAIIETKIYGEEKDALNSCITAWKKSTIFKLLHNVTPDKAFAKDIYGANWLELASKYNDMGVIDSLIKNGADVNARDTYFEYTPLICAAYSGNVELLKKLIEHPDLKTSIGNEERRTALMVASINANVEFVKVFLEAKTHLNLNVNKSDNKSNTALHYANYPIAKLLLAANADVNTANLKGDTPLHFAAKSDDVKLVKLLLESGANYSIKNDAGKTAFDIAKDAGYESVAKAIQLKEKRYSNFVKYITSGDLSSALLYLDKGFINSHDLDRKATDGSTLLISLMRLASTNGKDEQLKTKMGSLFEILKNHGVDSFLTNKENKTAKEIAKDLRVYAAQINMKQSVHEQLLQVNQGLIEAVKEKNYNVVEAILMQGINPDAVDSRDLTALHYAVKNGDMEMVKLLFSYGASVCQPANDANSSLHATRFVLEQKSDNENQLCEFLYTLKQHAKNISPGTRIELAVLTTYADDYDFDYLVKNDFTQPNHWTAVDLLIGENGQVNSFVLDEIDAVGYKGINAQLVNNFPTGNHYIFNAYPLNLPEHDDTVEILRQQGLTFVQNPALLDLRELMLNASHDDLFKFTKSVLENIKVGGYSQVKTGNYAQDMNLTSFSPLYDYEINKTIGNLKYDLQKLQTGGDLNDIKNETLLDIASLYEYFNQNNSLKSIVTLNLILGRFIPLFSESKNAINYLRNNYENDLLFKNDGNVLVFSNQNKLLPQHDFSNDNVDLSTLHDSSDINDFDKLSASDMPLIHYAVVENNVALIDDFFRVSADLTLRGNDGWSPIMRAANAGYVDMVTKLYEHANLFIIADLEDLSKAAYLAVKNGHVELVKFFLEKGVNPNAVITEDDEAATLLIAAINYDQSEVVDLLLSYGANPNYSNKQIDTPLHMAVYNNNIDAVRALIAFDANPNINNQKGYSPLYLAKLCGNDEIAQTLLECESLDLDAVDTNGYIQLHVAIIQNRDDIAEMLIKNGANVDIPDNNGSTPLHRAAYLGLTKTVELLLDAGADPLITNNLHDIPFYVAVKQHHLDVANKLFLNELNREDNLDTIGSYYAYATSHGISIFEWLDSLTADGDFDKDKIASFMLSAALKKCRDTGGSEKTFINGLLVDAVKQQSSVMVQALLKKGADPNYENEADELAIHSAIDTGNLDILKLLLSDARTDIDVTSYDYRVPVIYRVIDNKKFEILELLLGSEQCTPERKNATLEYAIKNNAPPEVVKMILSKGAVSLTDHASNARVESYSPRLFGSPSSRTEKILPTNTPTITPSKK